MPDGLFLKLSNDSFFKKPPLFQSSLREFSGLFCSDALLVFSLKGLSIFNSGAGILFLDVAIAVKIN